MVRLAGHRPIVSDLVFFDRPLRVRSENTVDLPGIRAHSPQSRLYRTNFVVAELKIVPMGRVRPLNEPILIHRILMPGQTIGVRGGRNLAQVCIIGRPRIIPYESVVRRR